jgi:threonine dehydrogenase-like Zn-dependent dehydrogenase
VHAWEVREGALHWCDVPEPTPRSNEIVVRVRSAGVCGSDVAKLGKAVIPTPPGRPWRPGHEIVGLVSGSDGVERLVAVNALVPCGTCIRCQAGEVNVCPDLQMVGWHLPGGFAPYVAVPEHNVVEVPAGVDEMTAVLADPMAVAVHGIRCGLGRPGGRLGVIGAGAVGTASAAYAAATGWQTDLLVRNPARVAGVEASLDVNVRSLQSVRPGEYDAVADAAGGVDDTPFAAALDAVRDGGRILVQTAYYPGVRLSRDLREPIRRALTIIGSFCFCRRYGDDFAEGLAFLARGAAWAKPFVGSRYPLDALPRALADLHGPGTQRPAKVVLDAAGTF